jgi:hypothetical protein
MCIISYYSKVGIIQRNLGTFGPCFLVLEAVLDRQNSTTQSLSSSTDFLTPLLSFFWNLENIAKKHEGYLMVFIEDQTIVVLTLKMKTSTMVFIKPEWMCRSRVASEIILERLCYVDSRHFSRKPHFIFSSITW